jgi:glycosyltransferase involved in cell wall biosynthesis
MQPPLISVLLPVYNEQDAYLKRSIESILNQTLADFELLILNDGSTSLPCVNLINSYAKKDSRIRLIKNNQNIGLTKTLNKGLQMALGQFIARQDSDDISEKNRFEKQLDFMKKNPTYALCGTWVKIIDSSGKIIGKQKGPVEYEKIKKQIILINSFIHSSWFFRKDMIMSLGGYSNEMQKAQDYDLLLKIATKFPITNIPEYLCSYSMNHASISFGNNKNQERYAIKARLKALEEYGYSKWEYLKMIRPIFFYLFVPSCIKKFLMRILWKI